MERVLSEQEYRRFLETNHEVRTRKQEYIAKEILRGLYEYDDGREGELKNHTWALENLDMYIESAKVHPFTSAGHDWKRAMKAAEYLIYMNW